MEFKEYLKRSQKEGWAIGHFNTSNLEVMRAIFNAAQKLKAPMIIGTSEGESHFIGTTQAVYLFNSLRQETGVPSLLNLDHGKDLDYIKKTIDAGYSSAQFDGSKYNLKENIRFAKEIADYAHSKGVLTEGEISFIKGASEVLMEAPEIREEDLTDPDEALKFITETGMDSLAVNVGTFHGVEVSGVNPHINIKRLKEIKNKIGDRAFLVLHGGSGTPEDDIREAIKSGINIIHINTELRIAFTSALKKAFAENPDEVAPYKYIGKAMDTAQEAHPMHFSLSNISFILEFVFALE